jgi:hypothetical protein
VNQHRDIDDARSFIDRKIAEGKIRRRGPPSPQAPPRQPRHPTLVEDEERRHIQPVRVTG